MSSGRHVNRAVLRVCFAAAACSMVATYSHSPPYELIYEGLFTSAEAFNPASSPAPIYFAGTNPFKIKARFDDSSPNLAPSPPLPPLNPFGGFRAYAPSAMTLEAAGQVFSVIGADNQGLSVRSSTRTASSQASMGWASSSMRSRRAPASLATSVRRHRISLWTHWYRPSSRASVASGTVPAPAVRARRPTAPIWSRRLCCATPATLRGT
jgi:hypothetical protein